MKKLFTTLVFIAASLSMAFAAVPVPSFQPATDKGGNVFAYDFGQVQQGSTSDIVFTIDGLTLGSTYVITIDEVAVYDNATCGMGQQLNKLFYIKSGATGTVGTGDNTFTIGFKPVASEVQQFNKLKKSCVFAMLDSYGIHSANVTITETLPVSKPARTAAIAYTLNVTGQSTSAITANYEANETTTSLAYPNPVKDILHVQGAAEVFNALGNKVATGINEINMTSLEAGVYTVKVDGKFQKVVKE